MNRRIAVCADLHFGRGGAGGFQQYAASYREMIASMIDARITDVYFAGDVFHQYAWFDPRTVETIHEAILLMQKCGVQRIVMMNGNHDLDRDGVSSALQPFRKMGCSYFSKIFNEITDNEVISIVPWHSKAALKSMRINTEADAQDMVYQLHEKIVIPELEIKKADANKFCICLFHASLIGFAPGNFEKQIVGTDFLLDPSRIKEMGYDLIVGGHFHRPNIKDGIGYVGAMERNDFGERENQTGWLEIDCSTRQTKFHGLERSQYFVQSDNLNDLHHIEGAIVKYCPKIARHEVFNREEHESKLYALGALKVVIEPEYEESEEVVRVKDIKVEQGLIEQFRLWSTVKHGESLADCEKLLQFENDAQYPLKSTDEHINEAAQKIR